MDYKLEGGALPPGSITHPHQKGIKVSGLGMGKSMLFLVIASKWFSNIPTKDYKLFSQFCEDRIHFQIPNTEGISPSIVKSMIKLMKDIEDSDFNYTNTGLNYTHESLFVDNILWTYFDEIYEWSESESVSPSMKAIVSIIKTVLEAVFIFTVYMQVVKHLIPNGAFMGTNKNIQGYYSSFWKLDQVKTNMLDSKRYSRLDQNHPGLIGNSISDQANSLYCWWYLDDEVAKQFYYTPSPPSLWANPPMGSILFRTLNKLDRQQYRGIHYPCYFFHMMLDTNTNPPRNKNVGRELRNYEETMVNTWNFFNISLTPKIIEKMTLLEGDGFLVQQRRLQVLARWVKWDALVNHQWFSSDPLWQNNKFIPNGDKFDFINSIAGFVKMDNTSNSEMDFINWPYSTPFNIG
jgi:hypothetical protein